MMRYVRVCAVVVLLMLVVQCASLAQVAAPASKYVQPVKLWTVGDPSFAFSSEDKRNFNPSLISSAWDDWVCPDGRPIMTIRWWGSYWVNPGSYYQYSDSLMPAASGGIGQFTVRISTDAAPSGNVLFNHPGSQLYSHIYTGNANETLKYHIPRGNGIYEDIYEYSIDLDVPFQQTKGDVYWLGIQAYLPDTTRQWGWREADGHWGEYAVQSWQGGDWGQPCGLHDLAFELVTSVPEPGSLMALGTGLMGLGGILMRRRRS